MASDRWDAWIIRFTPHSSTLLIQQLLPTSRVLATHHHLVISLYLNMNQIEYVTETDDAFTENIDRGGFGKLKVLLRSRLCTVTIGPDYCFFVPAFSFFLVIGLLVVHMVFANSDNLIFRVAILIVCLGQPLSYLRVALSNPGIASHSVIELPSDETSMVSVDSETPRPRHKPRFCKTCKIHVKPTTFHCSDCQLCIENYDHHCPWVSKCIGGNNLTAFYVFLTMTPIFMVYSFVAFFACASLNLAERASVQPTLP